MERYDLEALIVLISKFEFKRVVLQFPDEELEYCVPVYDHLTQVFAVGIDMYITADSTWGSSIDDVSAMHCDGDVLVYFGTDLSSSGTMPVIIVPPRKPIDVSQCVAQLSIALTKLQSDHSSNITRVVVFYEPGYSAPCVQITEQLSHCATIAFELAALPLHADLVNWIPHTSKAIGSGNNINNKVDGDATAAARVVVGGLLVSADVLKDKSAIIVYIGDKPEQIVNILLRLSENTVLHYSPVMAASVSATTATVATDSPHSPNAGSTTSSAIKVLKGTDSREFRERYGGVLRVKDAQVVGIIVGSMGLTGELTRDILHRLQTLIRAAHKKFYCFVMGRLNEAKLCNFPEVRCEKALVYIVESVCCANMFQCTSNTVCLFRNHHFSISLYYFPFKHPSHQVDIFCLVSNEDNANIKPK